MTLLCRTEDWLLLLMAGQRLSDCGYEAQSLDVGHRTSVSRIEVRRDEINPVNQKKNRTMEDDERTLVWLS